MLNAKEGKSIICDYSQRHSLSRAQYWSMTDEELSCYTKRNIQYAHYKTLMDGRTMQRNCGGWFAREAIISTNINQSCL